VPTLATFVIPSLIPARVGETAFCRENGRLMTYDGELWMCDDFIKLTNNSGAIRSPGDVMIFETTPGTTPKLANVTNTLGNDFVAGVVVYQSNIGSPVALAYKGIYKINCAWGVTPTTIGFIVRCGSTNGVGNLTNVYSNPGFFAYTLEVPTANPSLVRCLLRNKVEYS